MGAFMVIVLKRTAEEAWMKFKAYHDVFIPFRDAGEGASLYDCTVSLNFKVQIYDCLKGLEIAIKLGWYDFRTFDANEFEHYEKVENGDLNWVI
jgi:cell division cycle 14